MMTKTFVTAAAATFAASALALGGTSGVAAASTASARTADTYPACGNHALVVTNTPCDSGMGHSGMALLFRNKTGHTCTLRGYPGLDAVSRSGHVLAHARRTLTATSAAAVVRTVVVRPGHYAAAGVEWENFNPSTSGDCRFSHSVPVTPANTARAVGLPSR